MILNLFASISLYHTFFCPSNLGRRHKEELIVNAEKLKNIFLYTPIKVKDRFLSVNEITFDSDKSVLTAYFELEFLQETNTKTVSMPKMKTLNERTVIESGTSDNFN